MLTAVAVISLALLLFGQHFLLTTIPFVIEARFTDIPGVAAAVFHLVVLP